jgi:hypothetical protein
MWISARHGMAVFRITMLPSDVSSSRAAAGDSVLQLHCRYSLWARDWQS